ESLELGQRENQSGEWKYSPGPEDEHPLDEIGPLVGHLGTKFGAGAGQLLLKLAAEPLEVEFRNFPDFASVHSGRLIPPAKQVIGGLIAQGFLESVKQARGYRHPPLDDEPVPN